MYYKYYSNIIHYTSFDNFPFRSWKMDYNFMNITNWDCILIGGNSALWIDWGFSSNLKRINFTWKECLEFFIVYFNVTYIDWVERNRWCRLEGTLWEVLILEKVVQVTGIQLSEVQKFQLFIWDFVTIERRKKLCLNMTGCEPDPISVYKSLEI